MQPFNFHLPKHELLLRFATAANVLAWLSLAYYVLLQVSEILQLSRKVGSYEIVLELPLVWLLAITLSLVQTLIQGIIYWMVLKSISIALKMIVETDLNYRLRKEEDTNA